MKKFLLLLAAVLAPSCNPPDGMNRAKEAYDGVVVVNGACFAVFTWNGIAVVEVPCAPEKP